MTDQQPMTIYQLMDLAGGVFPFWITNWRPRHYCASVKAFGIYTTDENTKKPIWKTANVHDAFVRNTYSSAFLCDLYSLDKSKRLKRNVLIPGHNSSDWLAC